MFHVIKLCVLARFNTSLEKLEVKGDTLNGGHYVPWRHVVGIEWKW